MAAARRFLKEILASKGRRSDIERNAFLAAAAALVPSDVFKDRKGRGVMRLLDIDYRLLKQAAVLRADLEDGSKKWALKKTGPHADRSDWSPVARWLHSEDASVEDNSHKELVRVRVGEDEVAGVMKYEFHRARVLSETKNSLLVKFKRTSEFAEMRREFDLKKKTLRRKRAVALARKLVLPPNRPHLSTETSPALCAVCCD